MMFESIELGESGNISKSNEITFEIGDFLEVEISTIAKRIELKSIHSMEIHNKLAHTPVCVPFYFFNEIAHFTNKTVII